MHAIASYHYDKHLYQFSELKSKYYTEYIMEQNLNLIETKRILYPAPNSGIQLWCLKKYGFAAENYEYVINRYK